MFLGDHVLFDITPNITTWPGFSDPLGHYVHSLMDISIFSVRVPLPAHRGVKGSTAERVGTIIEHHGRRIREMLDALDASPGATPYELSGMMSWRVRGKTNSWADFPLGQSGSPSARPRPTSNTCSAAAGAARVQWRGLALLYGQLTLSSISQASRRII